jgi:hypothetical protein
MSLSERLRGLFVADLVDLEARLRFQIYTMFVALALPNMVLFGVVGLVQHNYVMSALVAASGSGLVVGWRLARQGRDAIAAFRANGLVFAVLALDMLVLGGDGGSKSLWIFVYPLIAFFLFGEREGAVWNAVLLASAAVVLWMPPPWLDVHDYPRDYKIRLVIVYAIVAVATFGFEHARGRYRDRLLLEQATLRDEKQLLSREVAVRVRTEHEKGALIAQLQETLAQVRTLKGLVPICAHCHRIRDDQGFWNQLEAYLRDHSEAQFSHGICPACLAVHYPEAEDASS